MAASSPTQGQSSVQTCGLMPILAIVGRMHPSLCPAMGEWVKEHSGTTHSGLMRMLPLLFCCQLIGWGPSGVGNSFFR